MSEKEPELHVVQVPVIDTGLGREADHANDAELLDVYNAQLTPEALARIDEAEREFALRFLFGGVT